MSWTLDLQKGLIKNSGDEIRILFNTPKEQIFKILGKGVEKGRFLREYAWYNGVDGDKNLNIRLNFDVQDLLLSIEVLSCDNEEIFFDLGGINISISQLNNKSLWNELIKNLKNIGIKLKLNTDGSPEGYGNQEKTFFLGYDDERRFTYLYLARPKKEILENITFIPGEGLILAGDGYKLLLGAHRSDIRKDLNYIPKFCKGPKKYIDYYRRTFEDSHFHNYDILLFFENDILVKVQIINRRIQISLLGLNINHKDSMKSILAKFTKKDIIFEEFKDKSYTRYINKKHLFALDVAKINKNIYNGFLIAQSENLLKQDIEAFIPDLDYDTYELHGWY